MLKEKKKTEIIHDCAYQIVFCTKYRKEVLEGEIKLRLMQLIEAFSREWELPLIHCEIGCNYVYLKVKIDPQISVHQVVRRLKAQTASSLRQEFKRLTQILPSMWTLNYWCTTREEVAKEEIMAYIESQQKRG